MMSKKYCQLCGAVISDPDAPDFNQHRHNRIKYCPYCAETMERLHMKGRVADFRQRSRQTRKLKDERIQLLTEENQLLRELVIELREQKKFSAYSTEKC